MKIQFSIRTKLYALSILGLFLAVAVGVSGYWGVDQVQKGSEEINVTNAALRNHLEAGMMRDALRADLMAAFMARDAKAKDDVVNSLQDHSNRFRQALTRNKDLPLSGEIKAKLQEAQPVLEEYIKSTEVLIEVALKDRNTALAEFGAFQVVHTDLLDKMGKLSDEVQASAQRAEARAASIGHNSQTAILSICGLALLVLLFFAAWITRSILAPIQPLIHSLKDIAEGDLTQRIDDQRRDEIGEVGKWFNSSVNQLRQVIAQLASTAQRLASASEEISSSATQQVQGSELQKDQTHQVATAMQEMSTTVIQVADHANRAADAARKAADTARHGGKIVDETLVKMRAIADSQDRTAHQVQELGARSDQIGEIIGVIDEIAGQTNLLALNAAIEAARAGEQGRGFAVVADEVRKLAERTTKATKEIAQMIKNIQAETKNAVVAIESGNAQVEEGLTTTAQAGQALQQIIQMAEQVGEMVIHIATAAQQQSGATGEVTGNMEQISKISHEAAAGAQQTARACHDLSSLALDLQNLVGRFKVEHGDAGRGASPAPQAGVAEPALQAA
jgi:methyl-accepting chemotaxis protein